MQNHALISKVRATRSQSYQQLQHNALLQLRSTKLVLHSQQLIAQSQQLMGDRKPCVTAPSLNSSYTSQLKTSFIVAVNHEFRTPLAVIATATELLKLYHSQLPEPKCQQYFQQIQVAIAQLIRLLETALTDIEADL